MVREHVMRSVPFHMFSGSGTVERRFPMPSRSGSQVGSPQFHLDLSSHLIGSTDSFRGLQFPNPPGGFHANAAPRDGAIKTFPTQKQCESREMRLIRAIWATQAFLALVLSFMVFGLLYWSYRFNYNVNYYYDAASPYLAEMRVRGMSMVRHADNSSAALEQVMSGAEHLTQTSIPALMDSVNRTTAMVARLEAVARNPTIKLSMA